MPDQRRPIVIRKIRKSSRPHSGQWKIAYADFVTAMMAFFLLMWLLSTSSRAELQGISGYFQPTSQIVQKSGSSSHNGSSVIQGGGRDLIEQNGYTRKYEEETSERSFNLKAAHAELERLDARRLEDLKSRLERLIQSNPTMRQFRKQLLLDITTEGLRIQIVDDQNRPMFALARAELEPHTKAILQKLGEVLNEMPNKVSLAGHTDATPYANGEKHYSNWELSADRANASRRQLVLGGMNEQKIMRVVGLSSAALFDKDDPANPVNRRISIIVMSKKAATALSNEGGETTNTKTGIIADSQASRPRGS